MIKFINNITQIIILLGCCAISIFILFVLIMFIKNVGDFAAITNIYDYKSYLYYNSNAAIDSGKPVNAEPTTCSISIIVVCGTNV